MILKLKYKTGKENGVADALSRKIQFSAITTVHCEAWEGLEEEILADEKLKKIVQDLLGDSSSHPDYKLKNGSLYREDRIVQPRNCNSNIRLET